MSVGVPGVPLLHAAGLDHVAGSVAGDHGGVVGAAMVTVTTCAVPSDGGAVKLSVSVAPPLSACTAALLLSSV